jgi:quercetin dioxygenase-like cupin family protein
MTIDKERFPPVRRVVTGHTADNVGKPLLDGPAENRTSHSNPGIRSTLIWSTDRMPAEISVGEAIEDMGARMIGVVPPQNGTRFAVIDFLPGTPALMHRTETIDYVIVMSGEIEMDMPTTTVKLKAGDVMVQRGTDHAWINRGLQPARVAFVLIDAEPLGVGRPIPRGGQVGQQH